MHNIKDIRNNIKEFKNKIDIRAANPNIYEKMLDKLEKF